MPQTMALTVLIPAKRRKYLKTRHDQALVVWNPLPPELLSGIYVPDRLHLQHLFLYQQPAGFLTCISTHTITFPVFQKNQWHNTNLMLLTVTRSRRLFTCFPFTHSLLSCRFRHPLSSFDMPPSYHPVTEKAIIKPNFVPLYACARFPFLHAHPATAKQPHYFLSSAIRLFKVLREMESLAQISRWVFPASRSSRMVFSSYSRELIPCSSVFAATYPLFRTAISS